MNPGICRRIWCRADKPARRTKFRVTRREGPGTTPAMQRRPPYARLLGLSTVRSETGELLWLMPFREEVIGRPGYLHGGAIAGLLEFAALGTLLEALGGEPVKVKPINVSVQFMRGGTEHETYAAATISRLGSRVAHVEAHCWQQDRANPIASAQMNVLLKRGGGEDATPSET